MDIIKEIENEQLEKLNAERPQLAAGLRSFAKTVFGCAHGLAPYLRIGVGSLIHKLGSLQNNNPFLRNCGTAVARHCDYD